MTPAISSLSLRPMPCTSRSRVAAKTGVPITRWPRRLGGRGPANTAGARSSVRTVAPGAFGTTSEAGDGAGGPSATRTTNLDPAGRIDHP